MKTVWGFEPKNQNKAAIQGMAQLLGEFCGGARKLGVAYVVTEHEPYLYAAFDVPAEERFTVYPRTLILDDLKKARVRVNSDQVHVLRHRTLSITKAVDQLLGFAKSEKAELLALFTQNKKGFERMLMGSFAETAVHRSPIDLLLAGPKTKYPKKVRNILYASDFESSSKGDLRRVIGICKRMRARLIVFHAAELRYRNSFDEANPGVQAYRRTIDQMVSWIESESRKAGVAVTVEVKADFESITDLTFQAARRAKADLIAVSAKTGPLSALMGGSVTRRIVRDGRYPVLILKD